MSPNRNRNLLKARRFLTARNPQRSPDLALDGALAEGKATTREVPAVEARLALTAEEHNLHQMRTESPMCAGGGCFASRALMREPVSLWNPF